MQARYFYLIPTLFQHSGHSPAKVPWVAAAFDFCTLSNTQYPQYEAPVVATKITEDVAIDQHQWAIGYVLAHKSPLCSGKPRRYSRKKGS